MHCALIMHCPGLPGLHLHSPKVVLASQALKVSQHNASKILQRRLLCRVAPGWPSFARPPARPTPSAADGTAAHPCCAYATLMCPPCAYGSYARRHLISMQMPVPRARYGWRPSCIPLHACRIVPPAEASADHWASPNAAAHDRSVPRDPAHAFSKLDYTHVITFHVLTLPRHVPYTNWRRHFTLSAHLVPVATVLLTLLGAAQF